MFYDKINNKNFTLLLTKTGKMPVFFVTKIVLQCCATLHTKNKFLPKFFYNISFNTNTILFKTAKTDF